MMPTPIWASTVIQNESLLMVREGERIQAPLLCHPKEITAVQNAALTIQYEPGRDWILEDDMLVIPKGSRIPVTEKEELIGPLGVEATESVSGGGLLSQKRRRLSLFQRGRFLPSKADCRHLYL